MFRWITIAFILTMLCRGASGSAQCGVIRKNKNKPQTGDCPYSLISPANYHYSAGTELHFRLDGNKPSNKIGFYEVKFSDSYGRPVGEFLDGGTLCKNKAVLVHDSEMKETRSVKFRWIAPDSNIGYLSLSLTIGVNEKVYWSDCKMAGFDLKLVYDDEMSTLAPITRRPTTQSIEDHPVGFAETWCKPDAGSPVYRPVKGTGCRQYQATVSYMPQNDSDYNVIDCSQYTMFDTSTCVCGHILRVECHVP